jgi:Bacterial dipeptidyl-peptidase Sh3 domain
LNAYRKDLADVALVGRVIASHYAEPLERPLTQDAVLRAAPSDDGEPIRKVAAGELFDLLDDSLGWAWGYAGRDRHVGYVPSDAIG